MSELLKTIVIWVFESNLSMPIYWLFHALAFVAEILVIIWIGKKLNIVWWKSFALGAILFVALYVWMKLYYWIESGFQNYGGIHIVHIFIYVPLFALPVAKILKIKWTEACYMVAPSMPINHMIGHLGCFFTGCCQGYPSDFGFFHPSQKYYYFPIQPIESLVCLAIVILLFIRMKKTNYKPDAVQYPYMMILYGSARFICEFLRDNEKILWGCSTLSLHALFMVVVGAIWLAIMYFKKKKA